MLTTPIDPRRLNVLASFLLTCPEAKLQDPIEARDLAERATKAAPGDSSGWNNLGAAYYRTSDYRKAVQALEEAAHIAPAAVDWYSLGMAHLQLGGPEAAGRWLNVLKASPKK